jgi:hypothetical protein
VRFQHKRGPNLLVPADVVGAGSFTDYRLATRASWTFQFHPHASLLVQGSYMENWSDRPFLAFTRLLFAVGVRIHF